jgi:dihydropteroate synthase
MSTAMQPPGKSGAEPHSAARELDCRGRKIEFGKRTVIVGILNATPDSFFDGGRWKTLAEAVARARGMVEEGAGMIDLGGQSTRPGHAEISSEEEIARVLPVLEQWAPNPPAPISIDTYKPRVARAALEAGAHLINDEHGFQGDPEMAVVAAEFGCPVVLMHCEPGFAGAPGDTMGKIKRYFARSLEIASRAGIPEGRLILDPGIGFHKTQPQNLEILARLSELRSFGLPLLLGVSRKSVIGHVLGGTPEERLEGTLATTALAVSQGVEFVRVHDVRANVRAARMAEAVLCANQA